MRGKKGIIAEDLQGSLPEIEAAWKHEARLRLTEIENGTVQPVEGEVVSAPIRLIAGR